MSIMVTMIHSICHFALYVICICRAVSPDSRPRDEFFSGENFLSEHDIESYQSPLSGTVLLLTVGTLLCDMIKFLIVVRFFNQD